MSVSSSLNQSDQIVYVSDGSDQQWSPESVTNAQNIQATASQWPTVTPLDCNGSPQMVNTAAVGYIQNNISMGPPNYFNTQNTTPAPNREFMDLNYQRRDVLLGNGYYNHANTTPSISYNILNTQRPAPPYPNNGYQQNIQRSHWTPNKTTNGVKKPKRVRTAFTTQQMMELELEYARTRYLDRNRRIELSDTLQLSEKTIKVWFQNRRMKDKKERAEGLEDSEATSTTESSPEMGIPQLPQYNYYHSGMHNGYNGNMYLDRNSTPVPTLDTNVMPVPVQNAIVNSYPNYFVPNVNVAETFVQNSISPVQTQASATALSQDNDIVTTEYFNKPREAEIITINEDGKTSDEDIDAEAFFLNDKESNVTSCRDRLQFKDEPVVDDSPLKQDSSPNENGSDVSKESDSGDNWELSWVRIMDLQE